MCGGDRVERECAHSVGTRPAACGIVYARALAYTYTCSEKKVSVVEIIREKNAFMEITMV